MKLTVLFLCFALCAIPFTPIVKAEAPATLTDFEQEKYPEISAMLERAPITLENRAYYLNLAELHAQRKDAGKTLSLYRALFRYNPRDTETWHSYIASLRTLGLDLQSALSAEEYTVLYPDDLTYARTLVLLYLYDLKRTDAVPTYLDYVTQTRDEKIAQDVAYLLIGQKLYPEAESWLTQMRALFPDNRLLRQTQAALYLDLEQHERVIETLAPAADRSSQENMMLAAAYEHTADTASAIAVLTPMATRDPQNAELILRLAYLHALAGDRETAEEYYARLANLKPGDYAALKTVGTEILFLGNAPRALPYLLKAKDLKPNDPEIWYWIAEAARLLEDPRLTREASQATTRLLGPQKPLNEDQTRYYLKARGHLEYTPEIQREYAEAVRQYPDNYDIRVDAIQLGFNNEDDAFAATFLEDAEALFPQQARSLRIYRAYLAYRRKDCAQAIPLYKSLAADEPANLDFQRALADTYYMCGHWRQAMLIYRDIEHADETALRINCLTLRRLRETVDTRVSLMYQYRNHSEDNAHVWTTSMRGFLTPHIQPQAEVNLGRFHARSFQLHGQKALWAWAGFNTFYEPFWELTMGLTHSRTDAADPAYGARIHTSFKPIEAFSFGAGYDWRALNTDTPQAVARGDRYHRGALWFESRPVDRLVLAARAEFDRHFLPAGESADIIRISPRLSYIVLTGNPYMSAYYAYTHANLADQGGFVARLPLAARIRAHRIGGYFAWWLSCDWFWEISASLGADFYRSDRFRPFDSPGLSTTMKWFPLRWLDLWASFNYFRENPTGFVGTSYNISMGVSLHWF